MDPERTLGTGGVFCPASVARRVQAMSRTVRKHHERLLPGIADPGMAERARALSAQLTAPLTPAAAASAAARKLPAILLADMPDLDLPASR